MSGLRAVLLAQVAGTVDALPGPGVLRVAVDGVDGAGKTVFGDELAAALHRLGRPVIRASVDGFHHPRAVRHRRGRDCPEGFFEDSYDYARLRSELLDPLGPGGDRRYRPAIFDHHRDEPVIVPVRTAAPGSVLVLDGIFLHREQLRSYWDFSVFLDADFEVTCPRMAARGDGCADPLAPGNDRYRFGQLLYLASCTPRRHADVVIDNNDLAAPFVVRAVG